jgi:hypothetical protein
MRLDPTTTGNAARDINHNATPDRASLQPREDIVDVLERLHGDVWLDFTLSGERDRFLQILPRPSDQAEDGDAGQHNVENRRRERRSSRVSARARPTS